MNPSHRMVCQYFPFYFVCSQGVERLVSPYGTNAKIVLAENNMSEKGKILFETIRGEDYDVLIRVDTDAIIFDLEWLIELAKPAVGKKKIIGNTVRPKTWNLDRYVRGGCHIVSSQVIREIKMIRMKKQAGFDKPFNMSIKDIAEIEHKKVFEQTRRYRRTAPVWHPPKRKKGECFERAVHDYRGDN